MAARLGWPVCKNGPIVVSTLPICSWSTYKQILRCYLLPFQCCRFVVWERSSTYEEHRERKSDLQSATSLRQGGDCLTVHEI